MGVKTKNKKVKPALDVPYAAASLCVTTEDISAGEIVYVSGRSGATREVTLADASSAVSSAGTLLIAKHAVPSGGRGIFLPWRNATGLDTSGRTLGDKVYLSGLVPGGSAFVISSGTIVQRQIGIIVAVDATNGAIDYDLSGHGVEVAGAGVARPIFVHRFEVPAGSSETITVPDDQSITDIWALITTGGAGENLVVTNDGNTVLSQATGVIVADDIVRADTLDATFIGISAGDDLVANFDGATLAGTVYIQTIKV